MNPHVDATVQKLRAEIAELDKEIKAKARELASKADALAKIESLGEHADAKKPSE